MRISLVFVVTPAVLYIAVSNILVNSDPPYVNFCKLDLQRQLRFNDISIVKVRIDKEKQDYPSGPPCSYEATVTKILYKTFKAIPETFKFKDNLFPDGMRCKPVGSELLVILRRKALAYENNCGYAAVAELSMQQDILNFLNQKE